MHDLPGPLRSGSTLPFVGRAAELEILRKVAPGARSDPRIVLVGGEPGSGKSRLVRVFADELSAEGTLVLYGACDAVVHTPYGPFVEALDQLTKAVDPDELTTALGNSGGELTRLLPDLPALVGELASPVQADPDTERHRLHTAVADLLAGVSSVRPVLLVLEDGHWADAPTLMLLRDLTRIPPSGRLLLLATFRDTEADVPEGLAEILADLRRSDGVVRLRLSGLSKDEVADFVRDAAGTDLGAGVADLAASVFALTEGNAFLVCEFWRALVETGAIEIVDGTIELTRPLASLGTPESVREVVSQRLSRLEPGTRDLLEVAATAGGEFGLELVRAAAGLDERQLLGAVDEAIGSGMIEEVPARGLVYRFSHELVRRALYDRLSGARRAELHLRVGEALEGAGGRSGRVLADLAHHFTAATPFGGQSRGVGYNVDAAAAAIASLDFDEAAERLRTALELRIDDPDLRAEVYLDLGLANHRGGKALEAVEAFRSAGEIARELDDASLLARAAIGFEDACWRPGIADQGAVELLEEATARLGDTGSELRVGLLAGLARALDFQGDHDRAAVVRAEAEALARDLHDRGGLATVLMRAYWSRGPSTLGEILAMLTEARDIGDELGNTEIRAEATAWRVPAFVALSDIDSARQEVASLRETAERTAQPFMLHVAEHYGSAIALCDGLLEEAEIRAERSRESSELLTGRDASGVFGIQMFSVRREQGRLQELEPVIRILAGDDDRAGIWRPGLASMLVELGMEEEARHELSRVGDEGLDRYRESLWLASLTYLTDACSALGDEKVAALVYPELEPLTGSSVMIGHLVACYGSADRYLGMLAATLGECERAEQHFELALELNRRMGSLTWLAHTAYEYARHLRARGEGERSERLLCEAEELADGIGMVSLLGRIAALAADGGGRLPDGLSAREVEILRLAARGTSNREIGAELFISQHTVANHMRSILRKTSCANRTEAASYAYRHGLVEA